VTIDVGGVAGGTQFVVLNAAVNTFIENTTGCPCDTGYVLTDDSFNPVSADTGFNLNDTLGSDVGDGAVGDDTGEVQAVVPVSTGGPHTFHVASFAEAGTGTVIGEAQITATTAAFGSTGGNTLNAQVAGGANHRSIPASVTAKLAGK